MERVIKGCLFVAALAIGFAACKKDNHSSTPATLAVILSKTTVKRGEPLYGSTNVNTSGNAVIRWTVNPPLNTFVSSSAGKSVILFSNAGNYTVTASYFSDSSATTPYDSSSSPVMVNDSVYNNDTLHCDAAKSAAFDSKDQITLTPLYSSDTGLVLIAHTTLTYPDVPSIVYAGPTQSASDYTFTFNSITEYPCYLNNGPTPALGIVNVGKPVNGTYSVSFSLLGTTYTGSMLVNDTEVSFTWPHSSGVIISPSFVNK